MWTLGMPTGSASPASRASSEIREMLAFAHIPTGATANKAFNIDEMNSRLVEPAVALTAISRHRSRQGYTLRRGSGCLTLGVHLSSRNGPLVLLLAGLRKSRSRRKMKSEERGVQVEIQTPPLATSERRPHRRITATKRAEIIAALKVKGNAHAVARQVGGVDSRSVWKIAKDESIELTSNRGGRHLPAEKRADIIAALNVDPNATQVARQVGGVSRVGVWKIAKAAGIELSTGKTVRGRHLRAASRFSTSPG
jgi:hypothetical protein